MMTPPPAGGTKAREPPAGGTKDREPPEEKENMGTAS